MLSAVFGFGAVVEPECRVSPAISRIIWIRRRGVPSPCSVSIQSSLFVECSIVALVLRRIVLFGCMSPPRSAVPMSWHVLIIGSQICAPPISMGQSKKSVITSRWSSSAIVVARPSDRSARFAMVFRIFWQIFGFGRFDIRRDRIPW